MNEQQQKFLDKLLPGDILSMTCVKRFDPPGRIIKWISGSKYTHSALYVGGDEHQLVEALYYGVDRTGLTETGEYLCDYEICAMRPINATQEQVKGAIEFAVSKIGKKYDYLLLLAMAPLTVLDRMGLHSVRELRNKIDLQEAYVCSELIVDSYHSVGLSVVWNINRSQVVPDDFWRSAKDLEKVAVYEP